MSSVMQQHLKALPGEIQSWATCQITPIWPVEHAHALHAYFNICPESPDGQWVLLFVSEAPDAHIGDICILERLTGRTVTLAKQITVEDAHRQAMQQWSCDGHYVVFMQPVDSQWQIVRVDCNTLEKTVLFTGAQLFCGLGHHQEVPLYGMPWAPGDHVDLLMLDVVSGKTRTVVSCDQVCRDFASDIAKLFAGRQPDSIAYPVISPDGTRVFFKLSCVHDGNYQSANASLREGLFVYDLTDGSPIGVYPSWGHPAWMPDSRYILRMNTIIDTHTMQTHQIDWYPGQSNSHANPSPDGTMLVMDVARDEFTEHEFHWAIVVGDYRADWCRIHTDPARRHGTTSWRPVHPHPVFNQNGTRIYFNANMGDWTTLCVAQQQCAKTV